MNRNDKNKKFTPLNINNVFKGKSVEPQNKPSYKLGGMQNIGKVSSMRRVPPPKWVPSLKAETGVSDGRQIINQSTSGWVNPVSSQENSELNNIKPQGITTKIGSDRSQWNTKLTANKPFFLIGQEFPSLQSDTGHETSQDSNTNKDKFKDNDSKSKIDELRNRDTNISVSTLNRIDALSISKSSKGDIAATGWAAEDEEPNFDEKIVFSDEESSNEIHNWHSDNEDGSKSERCEKRESIDMPPIISDVWHDQNLAMRFSQFQQMQIPMNVPGQFINPQFPTNIINRNPSCTINNMGDEQAAFMNSVAEQRNARNMEYMYAIERARQKKLATQSSRGSCGINDDHNQIDPALMRSRHTSITSDTTESMNTPIEMGPPGGPPMMHHLHKPHLQPQISPMIHPHNISVISPSIPPPPMIRFAPHPYNIMPISAVPVDVDSKLMEKFVEFLKSQSNNEVSGDNIINAPIDQIQQPAIAQETNLKPTGIVSISTITDNNIQNELERPQSHLSPLSQVPIDKENNTDRPLISNSKDNVVDVDKDSQKKSKSNYSHDEDSVKYDQSKKGTKNKNFKEYRSNKSAYKVDYSNVTCGSGVATDRDYYAENEVVAYEDYNTYKQHYSRDYKPGRSYNSRNNQYTYYPDQYSAQSRDNNYANDYIYKSNSIKSKSSSSKSKELKSSALTADHCQLDRDSGSSCKKYGIDNQEVWPHDNDITDVADKKNKDSKKNSKSSKTASYQTKKFDTRHYKEKSNEAPQEYSMGFAVNPKENRKNYYSNNYNRRYYDYKYYNSSSKYGEYDNEDNYYSENYYPQDYYAAYEKDASNYSSNKYGNKRNPKSGSNTGDNWRPNKDDKSNNPRNNSETLNSGNPSSNSTNQSKNVNRNNRKSDKRQFSTTKDNNNDNDQDEWETASEGGSVRSSSAPRDVHKLHNRQLNTNENKSISSNNTENRKTAMNKSASSYSCNGGNNSFNDNNGNQDGNGGASGSSGGNRFRSNVSQSRSVDSSQNKNMEKSSNNENRNSDSTSKNCSNNNNSSKENTFNAVDSKQPETAHRVSTDNTNLSPSINLDKFNEFIEDEDSLYENSQFQEVLSKATKKSRKLEEQRRLKEECKQEQKRLEALKFKSKIENNQNRKSTNRRDQPQRPNKTEITVVHKYENKAASNTREKEIANNTFKKWETNKVSMQIGSWDNSLADEISSEKKAPPKPIGTPASTVPWNKKVKGSFETNSTNNCQHTLSNESIKLSTDIETVTQPFSSENAEVNFNTTLSYSYNNSIYNPAVRTSEENKIDTSIETQNPEIAIHENINFEYDVKNINCDKSHRNLLSADRNVQNNDQKLLNDKINSVKTIWDSLPVSNIPAESKVTISSPSINQDLDIHTGPVSINQDVSNTRNIDNNLASPPVPIPNVCKVKPQLQQDFKKDHNEIIIPSQAFPIRNSPAAFLSQNQGGFLPYHRFQEFLPETLHATDGYTSLISNSQPGMHINYNLPNTHLIDSSLLRQNTQDQILSNKMNFMNQTQSSFYPPQATTPKLMSNTPAQMPINMDMGSAHGPPHHMQQLLLTRQNSLTSSMMQPNPMTIPFIQSGQQPIQAQTPIFPTTPLLGATNFSSQINPFSQTHLQHHYPHGNFPSLHHTPQFQPNQQMLLNQHPHHHQQQQLIQAPLSHDRVINSGGQSGVFNSVIGPSDISTNTGLPDFNGQPKPLTHHNNIMHGMGGSAFVLPHNLNILMKPSMFATNSQYNTFTTPIQSNLLNLKNGFDHNTNIKSLDLDHYRHDNPMNDRNIYCGDNTGLQKSNDEYYQDVSEYDNCDMNYDNWVPNLRYSKVDIYAANNLMSTFDFHSQKSPMQFSPMEAGGDAATYRNFITSFRDNHSSLTAAGLPTNTNLQYIISPRLKPQFNQEQSLMISNKQHTKCYDNQNYISSNNFISKNESTDNKISIKNGSNSIEAKDGLSKDISNIEKSITENKKNSKQRTSYSDNFEEKNQTWSLIEDDRSVPPEDNRSSIKSSNTENSSHSPNKQHFNNATRPSNNFDNQCQYGYDVTQLSSQTAESLRKFDQVQLKKVIMKLREGPVMTDTNCNEFDFTSYKGATIPRLMPLQSSSRNSKPSNKSSFPGYNSFSSDNYGNENVGLGFYSRNRALTPPAAQFRTYRNKTNRHANSSIIPNNNNNNSNNNSNPPSINRVSRQKCDTNNTDVVVVVDSNDLKLSNNVQSKSLECDNLVLENIIDNSIL